MPSDEQGAVNEKSHRVSLAYDEVEDAAIPGGTAARHATFLPHPRLPSCGGGHGGGRLLPGRGPVVAHRRATGSCPTPAAARDRTPRDAEQPANAARRPDADHPPAWH